MPGVGFEKLQRSYWRSADETRFHWQTQNPVLARSEAALVGHLRLAPGERLLEIGCGEGANLHHLRAAGVLLFGLDFSGAKAAHARRATEAHTVTGDAAVLPFIDGGFDAVLIRDVLHHVGDIGAVLAEAHRVLKPGGKLTLVEPNRSSPLILLQAAMIPAERGVLRSSASRLTARLSDAGFTVLHHTAAQPLPIERILLHPTLGAPSLAGSPLVTRALGAVDTLARLLLPRRAWMYLVFEAVRT